MSRSYILSTGCHGGTHGQFHEILRRVQIAVRMYEYCKRLTCGRVNVTTNHKQSNVMIQSLSI